MPSWIKIQWKQVESNAKWDLFKAGGAFLIAAAYWAFQEIMNHSPDWRIAIGLFLVSLIAFIYFGRKVSHASNQSNLPGSQSIGTAGWANSISRFDVEKHLVVSYTSPLQSECERNVSDAFKRYGNSQERESAMVRLIANGVISYVYDMVWAGIYRSQLLLLSELNRRVIAKIDIKRFYDEAASKYPDLYSDYAFDRWFSYMIQQQLILEHSGGLVEITNRGKDFLKYLIHWGRSADDKKY